MVEEVIRVIVDATGMDAKVIVPSARLNDLGLTSYALMRLLISIEDHFECEIDAADIYGVFTMAIADLPDVIERSVSAP